MRVVTWIALLLGVVGLLLVIVEGIAFSLSSSDCLSIAATVVSLLLAIYSIVYTCKTNKESQELLKRIEDNNQALVNRINQELAKNNYDFENIRNIENKGWRNDD